MCYVSNNYANWYSNSGEYVDMVKAGIIDPLKVIRTTLLDAARSSLYFSFVYLSDLVHLRAEGDVNQKKYAKEDRRRIRAIM